MLPGFHQKLEQQQAPAFFARGPGSFARLVFFSAVSLALMATDSRLQYLAGVRQDLMVLLHPLQVLANAPSQLYRDTDEYFSTHNYLLNENQRLKQQALKRDVALQRLNAMTLENDHLRNLLQANKAMPENSVLGEIMYVGRDPFTKKIIVNRGEAHQIIAGEAVVDATGVIGQVTRTYPLSSEVTLITDKSLAIPIQVERNGLRAIAFGHGRDNTLDLPYLPANVDIRRGDRLVTSGIDGVYPAGLAVATVSKIKVAPDSPFARIICIPTGGVENHRQVLLVGIQRTDVLPDNATGDHAVKSNTATSQSKLDSTAKLPQKMPGNTLETGAENTVIKQPDNKSKPNAPE